MLFLRSPNSGEEPEESHFGNLNSATGVKFTHYSDHLDRVIWSWRHRRDVTLESVLVRSTHRSHVTTIYRSLSSRILTLFVYMELEILRRPLVETDIPAPYLTLVKFTTVR